MSNRQKYQQFLITKFKKIQEYLSKEFLKAWDSAAATSSELPGATHKPFEATTEQNNKHWNIGLRHHNKKENQPQSTS